MSIQNKILAALFFALFFVHFTFAQQAQTPQIAVKVPLGETVDVDGVLITFLTILEDSRCPKGLDCLWAGRARVLAEVRSAGGAIQEKELIFGVVQQSESEEKELFSSENFTIEGLTLHPYPDSSVTEEIPKSLLIVKKDIED